MAAIPGAFRCTQSETIMENPCINLCSHLFNDGVHRSITVCPIDGEPLTAATLIPCAELATRIAAWKITQEQAKQQQAAAPVRNYLGAVAAGAPGPSRQPYTVPQKRAPTATYTPVHEVQNAHWDDIHGFLRLEGETFVSGSKDTTLKIWGDDGEAIKTIESPRTGYPYWITALGRFSNSYWASGTRDGVITIWNEKGNLLKEFTYNPSKNTQENTHSKDRNKMRINCITELETTNKTTYFYTGTPKFVQLWDGRTGSLVRYYQAHANDWVYCIEVLENNDLIVVIGADMELWDMRNEMAPTKSPLIRENLSERTSRSRPHISAIQRISGKQELLASALFDGSVRLIDLNQQTVIKRYDEHEGRVWSVINLKENVIGSSADDGTIKLYDIRTASSVATIAGEVGRVSSLLSLSPETFISGACPDKVFTSAIKASIRWWDLRALPV